MRHPPHVTVDNLKHQAKQAIQGNERYPFVLMLEPLYTCNLACIGCAEERHTGKISDRISLDQAIEAVEKSQAPQVSICGGEPLVYPELPELIDEIIKRKRHIYLCTNALLLDRRLYDVVPPHKRLTINVHLDGMRETHDYVVDREGVFDKAIEMMKEGKERGYRVIANTTVYKETEIEEVEELCDFLFNDLDMDGMLLSPGYHYETAKEDIFMTQNDIETKFKKALEFTPDYPITSTPMFLEFAAGERDYDCSPWSTVTYTPKGWKAPCYLIGENFYDDFQTFWDETDWEYWESRQDEKCQNCKMHSGFEASVLQELPERPGDILRLAKWNLLG